MCCRINEYDSLGEYLNDPNCDPKFKEEIKKINNDIFEKARELMHRKGHIFEDIKICFSLSQIHIKVNYEWHVYKINGDYLYKYYDNPCYNCVIL